MYCSNCGAEAAGNFCSKCGSPLKGDSQASLPQVSEDWRTSVNYDALVHEPEVRNVIAQHASLAKKGMSSEEFLALADKVVPFGFSIEKLATTAQPIYARLGIKTGKEKVADFDRPAGVVVVAVLCSLARHSQVLRSVQQFENGCLIEASMPSDIWSFEGSIFVTIRCEAGAVRLEAATKIEGQLFDWGKSQRCLDALFSEIESFSG